MALILIDLVAADDGNDSTLWSAYDDAPTQFRRVLHVEDELISDAIERYKDADVWIGTQVSPIPFSPVPDAPAFMAFAQEPRDGYDEEFNDWMDTDHIPALSKVPGVLATARFVAVAGEPRYCAIYYLSDPELPKSDAWQNAASTPWTLRMRTKNHNRKRGMYVRPDSQLSDD